MSHWFEMLGTPLVELQKVVAEQWTFHEASGMRSKIWRVDGKRSGAKRSSCSAVTLSFFVLQGEGWKERCSSGKISATVGRVFTAPFVDRRPVTC